MTAIRYVALGLAVQRGLGGLSRENLRIEGRRSA
jgi:hypothetical protein